MGNSVANTGMHNPTGGVWRPSNNGVIVKTELRELLTEQWRTQEFFSGGVQQIQLRTEDTEDGDLGAVAP